jgi:hypothetical protein
MKKYILYFIFIFVFFRLASAQEQKKWNVTKSTHFIIYYESAPQGFIDRAVNKAEQYYDEIADDLGFRRFNFWLWDNRAKIYIYDSPEDYQSSTGQPGWSGGCAVVAKKVIHTFVNARGFFETVLPHEMGHIIFREFVGFDNSAVSLWLDEGVASYQQKTKYSIARQSVRNAIQKGYLINIENLSGLNPQFAVNSETVQLFYLEAFSIVDFLIKEFGKDSFVLFCQNLRDKRDLERAIASGYPFSNIKELDQAWQKYYLK